MKTLLIVTSSTLLFFGVASFFVFMQIDNRKAETQNHVTRDTYDILPQLECEYENDQAAYADAITTKNVSQCACISDDGLNDMCKESVMDVMFYTNAINYLDGSLCEKIINEIRKKSCIAAVNSSAAKLSEQNPQYLAQLYATTHNENAILAYENLTKDDQESIANYLMLALAYAEKGLKEQERGNDQSYYVEKAFAEIEKAKAIDENHSEVYRVEGYINEIKPDYTSALANYSRAITIDQNNVFAYVGRGHVNRMMGTLMTAVDDFNKAAELDQNKNVVQIYTNLCNLEYSRSNYEDAIKNCLIVTQSKNADVTFRSEASQIMAMIYIDNGDLIQARNFLLTAKTLTPNDANLYVSMAKLNIFEQNYIDAESNSQRAIELSSTKTSARLSYAQTLYMQERYAQAIQEAEKGITLVKDDVSLLASSKPAIERDLNYLIAHCYRKMGDMQQQDNYIQKGNDVFNR